MKRTLRTPLLFMSGTLLIQLAWIWAVPPFRGIDEFDHAYRAASVAEGYWSPEFFDLRGAHGSLIPVPVEMVKAARAVCASYEYTAPANCRGTSQIDEGLLLAASGAARYNPVFYWLVGTPARIASGSDALYIMRAISAFLCSSFVGLTAWILSKWARTYWPFIALMLALTPVTLYGFMLPAPNGVEMAAALCLWASLLGLASPQARESIAPALMVSTIASAIPLVGVRTLGPVWFGLILATGLILSGRRAAVGLAKAHKRLTTVSIVVMSGATIAAAGWTFRAHSNSIEGMSHVPGNPWTRTATQLPLWFLQSIAAFPTRNEPAPVVVYVCGALCFIAFLSTALVIASSRTRVLLVGLCILSLGVPYALTVTTYHAVGLAWQGRYTLPLAFGVVMLAGYAWDSAPVRSRIIGPALFSGWLCITIAQVVGPVFVLERELEGSPMAGDPRWHGAPPWALLIVTTLGMCLMALATRTGATLGFRDDGRQSLGKQSMRHSPVGP